MHLALQMVVQALSITNILLINQAVATKLATAYTSKKAMKAVAEKLSTLNTMSILPFRLQKT
jgi:hypothetical protein